MTLMISSCRLCDSLFICTSLCIFSDNFCQETYEITLISVSVYFSLFYAVLDMSNESK
jgi:hypothetical protein